MDSRASTKREKWVGVQNEALSQCYWRSREELRKKLATDPEELRIINEVEAFVLALLDGRDQSTAS